MFTGGSFTINDIYGNTLGLKTNQIKKIQRIYRRRIFPQEIITLELAHYLASLAWDIKRQLGVLINRQGIVEYVIAGDAKSILIPDLSGFRSGTGRLKGLRCIHTHLREEPLSQDDCNDLALLRLDLMAALKLSPTGVPDFIHFAHLLPDNPQGKIWQTIGPVSFGALNFKFLDFIEALENEFARRQGMKEVSGFRDLAG